MLAYKRIRKGDYWPTIKQDAIQFFRYCEKYLRNANQIHVPASGGASITVP
jgi:hypothetical protein